MAKYEFSLFSKIHAGLLNSLDGQFSKSNCQVCNLNTPDKKYIEEKILIVSHHRVCNVLKCMETQKTLLKQKVPRRGQMEDWGQVPLSKNSISG